MLGSVTKEPITKPFLRFLSRTAEVFIISLLAVAAVPGSGNALYAELHALLSYDAAFMPGVPGEVVSFVGEPAFCASRTGQGICNGAYDEDADRDPRLVSDLSSWIGLMGWGTHFWNPEGGPHGGRLMNVGALPINIEGMNAYERATVLYDSARILYPLDPPAAYYLLGKVSHLLTDMATPAHVHLDPHVSAKHSTGDDSFEEFTAARYVRLGMDEGLEVLRTDFPPSSVAAPDVMDLPDGGYPEEPPLFRLFLSMASASAQYDSDDADGFIDKGSRRGISASYEFKKFLSAAIYGAGQEYQIPPFFYQLSSARRKFILPSAEMAILSRTPSVEGIRLFFEEGTEQHPLAAFSGSDMGDYDLGALAGALLPAAAAHTASLYRIFWADVHPSVSLAEAPGILLNSGITRLDLISPQPLEIRLDLVPGGWTGIETEVYIWASFPGLSAAERFYYDGTWKPSEVFSDMKPFALSYRLDNLHNIMWKVLEDSSALAGRMLTLTVCVDRALDGLYSPAESICGALPVRVRREQ